jgi:hypothetical protein
MRTAEGVLAIIKDQDPDTEVTLYYLRGLIRSGKIPVTMAGRKRLVNADYVIDFIRKGVLPEADRAADEKDRGQIRAVPM